MRSMPSPLDFLSAPRETDLQARNREIQVLLREIERTARSIRLTRERVAHCTRLTRARIETLRLFEQPRVALPLPLIADRLGITRQSAHRLLVAMSGAGLIRFEAQHGDRQTLYVYATRHGLRLLADADQAVKPYDYEIALGMSSDGIRATTSLMQRLTRRSRRLRGLYG